MEEEKEIYMYFHAGSKNHGCEAIVRSSARLLEKPIHLISAAPAEDMYYKLDTFAKIETRPDVQFSVSEKIRMKLSGDKKERYGYHLRAKREADLIPTGSIALSIGGDNYCYGTAYNYYLEGINLLLHRKGCKTVLWGCSVEPADITSDMRKDFARYDLITARESISYQALRACNPNTILVCDTAFALDTETVELPDRFEDGRTVGINLSPLIQKNEPTEGITLENYENMIGYIIEQTDYQIALIPHVIWDGNDDRVPLKMLFDKFKNTDRIVLIEDCNCEQLKGYISRCALFIGARTHATIAAYSSLVPTLVVGYSTKAKGIACDLFGTEENYVLPVQSLKQADDMKNSFIWLDGHKEEIHRRLNQVMPEYIKGIEEGVRALKAL